jgi:hypothetical protein
MIAAPKSSPIGEPEEGASAITASLGGFHPSLGALVVGCTTTASEGGVQAMITA